MIVRLKPAYRIGRLSRLTAAALALLGLAACRPPAVPRASGPLRYEAYVWQRVWTPPVREAVARRTAELDGVTVLAAEIRWRNGLPDVLRVHPPFSDLAASRKPVGMAIRIGSYRGPFAASDSVASLIATLAAEIVAEAHGAGLAIAELQIDFDCAESALDGYRLWLGAIQREVAPLPVTITALPSWLDRRAFGRLARCAGRYVLQVHSLRPPDRDAQQLTLCDPAEATASAERAARLGIPFRIALPTYGYRIAVDASGRICAVDAEGEDSPLGAGATASEVRADPAVMAGLVRQWAADRPALMQGIIWYRLPAPGDRRNWRWPTLRRVMTGEAPRARMTVASRSPQPGLVEIELLNDGEADAPAAPRIAVAWPSETLAAADAVNGFTLARSGAGRGVFRCADPAPVLSPGERLAVGWLRLTTNAEVHCEIASDTP